MKYSMEALFDFMDSRRKVKVTCTDGQVFTGLCWAYGSAQNEEEYGVAEPSLEVGPGVSFYASEIEKIEYAD